MKTSILKIKLNDKLVEGVKKGSIKAADVVEFLLNHPGITTSDKKNINNIAIKDLKVNNGSILSANLHQADFEIELIYEVVEPAEEDNPIFKNMIDEMLSNINTYRIKEGIFTVNKGNILLNDEYYFTPNLQYVKDRDKIANDFIKKYSYVDIRNMLIKKLDDEEKQLKTEEKNKHKLNDLIQHLEKFNKYYKWNDIQVLFDNILKKYYIKFSCKYNSYNLDNIKIYNTDNNQYILKINLNEEVLNKQELLNKLNQLEVNYKKYYEEKQQQEQEKLNKIKAEQDRINGIFNIYSSSIKNKCMLLFKQKNNYFIFNNGNRYSIGKGKRGKYYNCSFTQLEKIITDKNINQFAYVEKDFKIDQLNNVTFKNIY